MPLPLRPRQPLPLQSLLTTIVAIDQMQMQCTSGCKLHATGFAHHDVFAICPIALAQIDTHLSSLHPRSAPPNSRSLRMSAPPMPVAAPAPPLFALLIPGRTLATNFTVIDQKKMMIQVPAPASIPEVTVCMLQPSIPADHAVAVYYALPPFSESVSRLHRITRRPQLRCRRT